MTGPSWLERGAEVRYRMTTTCALRTLELSAKSNEPTSEKVGPFLIRTSSQRFDRVLPVRLPELS